MSGTGRPGLITVAARSFAQRRMILGTRPLSANQLHQWLRVVLDIEAPREAIMAGASAPFDYLRHAFFMDEAPGSSRDCVVWACRGGGKTFYAAVATLLDMHFKPGIEVKILGGSLEQSRRMQEHLRRFFERPLLAGLVGSRMTERRITLRNGSSVETLAQSHTSVRGARPQIMRCDEAELFDPAVWGAAQLAPRSKVCGGRLVRGAVEALSTMHQPGGLMSRLIAEAAEEGESGSRGAARRRLFRWSAVDVLERCAPARACEGCALRPECRGRAKRSGGRSGRGAGVGGHVLIEDAIMLKARADRASWESEMLCLRPTRSDAVFPEFDPALHVGAFEAPGEGVGGAGALWIAGMDFGLRAPTVILWAFVDESERVRVIDERRVAGRVLGSHIEAIKLGRPREGEVGGVEDRRWPVPSWIAVDPAGRQRNDQTGVSDEETMRRAGLCVRVRAASIETGLRAVRARLAPASGAPRIVIHPRCTGLIEALQSYHYSASDPHGMTPVKDGPDHAVDALRYMVVALELPSLRRVNVENYLE